MTRPADRPRPQRPGAARASAWAADTAGRWSHRLGREVGQRLGPRLATMDLQAVNAALLAGVDTATGARWDAAVERAAALPVGIRPDKIRAVTESFARELAAVGATAGVAAAAPVVGTMATLAFSAAEIAWFTTRAGDLILTIAALHGRPTPSVDERRAWVLAVLIFGSTAREGLGKVLEQHGVSPSSGAPGKLPLATVRAANTALARMLAKRYGTRRGVVALGTALPLGIGALVGGSANYVAVRSLARNADSFFSRLPYSAIDV